ncbi:MAG: DUF4349 domain-containing protein [Coriobacteriia bacterium]|nr:DUF4349 domain-containing protein [Coriobacteriia bacterium]
MRKIPVVLAVLLMLFALTAVIGCASDDSAAEVTTLSEPQTTQTEKEFVAEDSATLGIGGSRNLAYRSFDGEEAELVELDTSDIDVRSSPLPETSEDAEDSSPAPRGETEQNRMLIFFAEARLETKNFDQSKVGIESALSEAGGHTQDSELTGDGSENNLRTYRAVLRVPQDKFEGFVEGITEQGNLLSLSKTGDDVTDTFFDNEARIKILEAEEAELLEFMERAVDMSDLFEIRDRISEVRTDIERLRGQNLMTEDLAAMSTVTVTLTEVQTITPPAEEGFLARAGHTFTASLEAFGNFVQGIALVLIAVLPFALVFLGIPAVVLVVVLRRYKKKKAMATAAHQNYSQPKADDSI